MRAPEGSRPGRSGRRDLVAAVLVVLIAGVPAAPALAAERASGPVAGDAPGAVTGATVVVDGSQAGVSWSPPSGGPSVDRYQVVATEVGAAAPESTTETTASSAEVVLPRSGVSHTVAIRAIGADDAVGPAVTLVAVPPLRTVDAFLRRLSLDYYGRLPTALELAGTKAVLADGSMRAIGQVQASTSSPSWATEVDPVVRLYLAFFQRLPDNSGMRHWTSQRRAGTSLVRIANVFAASPEFRHTYGSLSHAAFVRLVYRNVFEREADASGAAYWTKRLDDGSRSPGQMMATMSESREHRFRRSVPVLKVGITWGMLGRVPTPGLLARWPDHSQQSIDGLTTEVLTSPAYVARVAAT